MEENMERARAAKRRILIFLGFAFGIAWVIGLIIFLTGGLIHSPVLIPGSGITLAGVLLALGYMMAPTLANILTRLITREGSHALYLRPHIRLGWLYWIAAWIVPAVLTLLGAALFFLLFPQYYDPALSTLHDLLAKSVPAATLAQINLWSIVAIQIAQAVILAPLLNGLFTFGEEFGWRAYLLPKLLPLGTRTAVIALGVIWGVWHWPIIAMGHNYGLNYPGAPWSGMLMMVWFTLVTGTFLCWVTLRSGSVWPAVIGHAAINGIAGIGALFVQGQPDPLLGPLPVGLIGSIPWVIVALWILLRLKSAPSSIRQPETQPSAVSQSPG